MAHELKLQEHELDRFRNISIHIILGIDNTGRKISIDCPFHNERTKGGSWIYPDNSFHCYSCQAHGNNALDFMMALNAGNFLKSLDDLIPFL